MYVYLDETTRLGLDCVTQLSPRRAIAYGWTMVPRGLAAELGISAGAEGVCRILHASFHTRNDVVPADPSATAVNGFTLLFDLPEEEPQQLAMTLSAGEALLRADLRDARLERNLARATAARRWHVSFDLMQQCARQPELAALLHHGGRPFGAFADWLAAIPVVRGRAADHGRIAEVEALALPSGEVLVMLRAAGPLPPSARIVAALIGWLRAEPGMPAQPVPLELLDWHGARLPAALAGYGRVDGALLDRLLSLEVIIRAEPAEGEEVWLRCQPASATVPDLLDAACRGTAATLALPVEAAGSAGLAFLREVIARREAAFAPLLAAFATPDHGAAAAAPGHRGAAAAPGHGGAAAPPRLALLLGADDPAAARLFHVTAGIFARHCDTLLVMGAAADEAAQAFASQPRLQVLTGEAAAAALQAAAGRGGVLAVDAAAFAEAVIAGTPDAAFTLSLGAADLARLLALHIVAGCAPTLSDSLQRLLQGRRAARFPAVPRHWGNRHAAEPANAHLARLWAAGGAAGGAVAHA